MGKRKSTFEELLDMLFEITGMIWQVGAVISLILAFLSVRAFFWIQSWSDNTASSTYLAPLADTLSWLLYGLPLTVGLISLLFAIKTYRAYTKQQYY